MNRGVFRYGYKLGSRIVALEARGKYSTPHSISSPTTWRIHRTELVCLVSREVET